MREFVYKISFDHAFELASSLTGESVSELKNKFETSINTKEAIQNIALMHSEILFLQEEIHDLTEDRNRQRELVNLFSR